MLLKRAFLAVDANPKLITFPTIVQPKIDGVRGLNIDGKLKGRSLKNLRNRFTTHRYSQDCFLGFDGELIFGQATDDDLCRETTSAVSTAKGEPDTKWHVFDYLIDELMDKPYLERYNALKQYVLAQKEAGNPNFVHIELVPMWYVHSETELMEATNWFLSQGYEGLIQRDPNAMCKQGRATQREASFGRIKPYEDTEGYIVDIIEAQENLNEPFIDERGYTKRSSHKENKIGKGMAGALLVCRLDNNEVVRIGPGRLTHEERYSLWENKDKYIADKTVVKFRHFPKGVLNAPRQARFLSFRDAADMVDY